MPRCDPPGYTPARRRHEATIGLCMILTPENFENMTFKSGFWCTRHANAMVVKLCEVFFHTPIARAHRLPVPTSCKTASNRGGIQKFLIGCALIPRVAVEMNGGQFATAYYFICDQRGSFRFHFYEILYISLLQPACTSQLWMHLWCNPDWTTPTPLFMECQHLTCTN